MSTNRIGVRREDKSRWERRSPLTPDHVRLLKGEQGILTAVQPSDIRIFDDQDYVDAGAAIDEALDGCPVVLAVKEIPLDQLHDDTAYLFFSHTIKGQAHNMPLLQALLDGRCTLIDYERITDDEGRRLVFFGRHAGLAGMVDTLWAFGERLRAEGMKSPFDAIRPAHTYATLDDVRNAAFELGERILADGLPSEIEPVVFGFAGYGNVSMGAQEIFDLLPHIEVAPNEMASAVAGGTELGNRLIKVVFREEHLARPIDGGAFDLDRYYAEPDAFEARFETWLPDLTVLVNCIYWDARYPRLITKDALERLYAGGDARLKVIGDITCDVEGSIECNVRTTDQDDPIYTYRPGDQAVEDGATEDGVTVLAVDNLPCELPHDASNQFGDMLMPFLPALAACDFSKSFDDLELPPALKRATIVHRGQLTPDYLYLDRLIQAVL